ncbi:trans AT polyketide synthase of type I involved in bacillaene synthesis (fragment) [Paenibacillus alvei]|uniref:Trans AT polyketide synthase of type I involved in bacillaene synthesis n=1 Tax=Paenibacillus alvei TaxID=44250 RepID=A0A383RB54_PAEAL
MDNRVSIEQVLNRIKCGQMTSEEGFRIIQEIKRRANKHIETKRNVKEQPDLDRMCRIVIDIASAVLFVDGSNLDPDTDKGDYGFDSITITEFMNRINARFHLEISPPVFYEHATIRSLCEHLLTLSARKATSAQLGSIADDFTAEFRGSSRQLPVEAERIQTVRMPAGSSAELTPDSIAIIGISGVMPQSDDLNQWWEHLMAGHDLITEIPSDRWDWKDYFGDPAKQSNSTNVKWGGFMNEADKFDASFFGISPREAELMDPRQRIYLETVWKVIEDAGYKASELSGSKTGLFVGVGSSDYYDLLSQNDVEIQAHTPTGVFPSILCNRISYLLHFHGPSEPVDTACSASLVAVHRAVEAIRSGDCELAIAGGVNVIASPNLYIALSKAGMLSKDGRCRTFDQRANGYVRSEGSGAVLLKPLRKAQEDGDHIYAVIRATSVNHGGHANSLTTPNPNAQASLIADAWRRTGIDPATISYIETHGTGTPLGDPIEINGLKKAFDELYREWGKVPSEQPHCALGAVKSNTGHLESAAGITGLLKVILSMKHGKLPANLHGEQLNPYIELQGSPFYILNEAKEWDKLGEDIPRRAGVSSFGFGGVNAHVVLEEYAAGAYNHPTVAGRHDDSPQVVVLSAKNEARLDDYVKSMLDYVSETSESLSDIAYTLQAGREAMQERLAVVVSTLEELQICWSDYGAGKKNRKGMYRGSRGKNQNKIGLLVEGEEGRNFLQSIWKQRKYDKLAELWASGIDMDWSLLHERGRPHRIPLPTYPFSRDRHWIPVTLDRKRSVSGGKDFDLKPLAAIHPLLHLNTSNLKEQRYSSSFTGEEFFLRDHVIGGSKILPGVAYLEMARAAVEQAAEINEHASVKLKHIVWKRPIHVESTPVQIHIRLYPEDSGEISYEIYKAADEKEEPIIFSQGRAVIHDEAAKPEGLTYKPPEASDGLTRISSDQYYKALRDLGFLYGAGHQAIEYVCAGTDRVLAKLTLPPHMAESGHPYVLHPSLMDAALQASVALTLDLSAKSQTRMNPSLPFALEELEVFASCTSSMWANVRYCPGSGSHSGVQKLNIELYDEHSGNLCVRMNGFSARAWIAEENALAPIEAAVGTILLEPCWQEQREYTSYTAASPIDFGQHIVLLCEGWEACHKQLEREHADIVFVHLSNGLQDRPIDERFRDYGLQVLEQIQLLMRAKPDKPILLQLVVPYEGERQLFAGLTGLLHTARIEHPKLVGQLLEANPEEEAEQLLDYLFDGKQYPDIRHMRYSIGQRFSAGWIERNISDLDTSRPWKERGIYLITGGTGGLGLIFAEEIASQAKGAVLLLAGRSEPTEEHRLKLATVEALGARVEYFQADVSDRQEAFELIRSICHEYGELNGIIHGAGMIRDEVIIRKNAAEAAEVLAPKVSGLVHLDEASREMPLDFFIMFSSVTAVIGNPGQADYAMANSFMDRYASYRNELVASGRRQGRTLSVNWPLWKEGGMRIDAESEKMLVLRTGMLPMDTRTGIQLLYTGMAMGSDQIVGAYGNLPKLRTKGFFTDRAAANESEAGNRSATLAGRNAKQSAKNDHFTTIPGEKNANIPNPLLAEQALTEILSTISGILKVNLNDIDIDAEFGEHGFDSIMLTELANKLNEGYKLELTPTIFFEYPAIRSFIDYLVTEHAEALTNKLAASRVEEEKRMPLLERHNRFMDHSITDYSIADRSIVGAVPPAMPKGDSLRAKAERELSEEGGADRDAFGQEPIAIIGMCGKFPMSEDIDALWRNLVAGKHCITEIPEERWDWKAHYGDPAHEANRTNIKWGGFIDGIDEFDPLFFGISPKEAEFMDPQQRLLMSYAWKAIEDAGYSARGLSGSRMGIFVGTMSSDYSHMLADANVGIEGYSSTGKVSSIGPNRMSYFLNVHGPSEPIETACSSSLIAVHRAINAINCGDCDTALVGGVNTLLTPSEYISFSKAGMLSEDGKCKTFSANANGYVRGEGVGMLFLKKLKAAEMAGDHIYGVIIGSSENHGGRASSLTAPNPKAQAELLKEAYRKARIDPRTVTYIEAHGTGTQLGDPIEINGLKSAFKELNEAYGHTDSIEGVHCGLGSIKTNIGHLELAAGIAGLIKVLLQMQHKTIVKNLHLDEVNPYIRLENSPFFLVRDTIAWNRRRDGQGREIPRRAGVSSFGFGGANAHIVLQEYIPNEDESPAAVMDPQKPAAIVFSAKTKEQLTSQASQFLAAMYENKYENAQLSDIAYTLQVGRDAMEYRLAMVVHSVDELREKLLAFVEGRSDIEHVYLGRTKRLTESLGDNRIGLNGVHEEQSTEEWLRLRDYSNLLKGWVEGLFVDWSRLYEGSRPRRMKLPTYPFAKERYWVPRTESLSSTDLRSIGHAATNVHSDVGEHASPLDPPDIGMPRSMNDTIFLAPIWEICDRVKDEKADFSASHQPLLIGDRKALRSELREYFPPAHVAEISPDESVDDIASRLRTFGPIEHLLWIAPDYAGYAVSDERIMAEQEAGTIQIFRIMKSLLLNGYGSRRLNWTIATIQALAVHNHETIDPTHAGIYGLAQLMRRQFPLWNIQLIDLEAEAPLPITELKMSSSAISQDAPVAYRNGDRYIRQLVPVRNVRSKPTVYKQKGTYVMIGIIDDAREGWFQHLTRTYGATLIWIGANDTVTQNRLEHAAAMGLQVDYIPANHANAAELSQALRNVKLRYSRIDGILISECMRSGHSLTFEEESGFRARLVNDMETNIEIARFIGTESLDFVVYLRDQASSAGQWMDSVAAASGTFKASYACTLASQWPCAVKILDCGPTEETSLSGEARQRIADKLPAAMEALLAHSLRQLIIANSVDFSRNADINFEQTIVMV